MMLQANRFTWPIVAISLLVAGCTNTVDASRNEMLQQETVQRQMVEELFNNAIALLNDVEHSDSADLLDQVINRLNQWIGSRKPLEDWQVDPLAGSLPDELKKIKVFGALDNLEFRRIDSFWLQEAVWLRNAARNCTSKINDPLKKAEALFDWTVRQINLVNAADLKIEHAAWEAMLIGRGTAVDRLWVFTLLARQQGLDVVVLAVDQNGQQIPWAAGLLHQKQLYLFEPKLGLPIPSTDGKSIATLDDAVTKPEVLKILDIDPDHPYRFHSEDLKKIVALIEGSPPYLSQRFRQVELRLAGDERLVLSVDATGLAEQIKKLPHVADAQLWQLPWHRAGVELTGGDAYLKALNDEIRPFRIPPAHLWKGRVLHIMGRYSGEISATDHYQAARPPDEELDNLKLAGAGRSLINGIKEDATYWLGLLAYERGNYETALHHLQDRLLKAHPNTRWKAGAQCLIGRSYEAQGKSDEAIKAYRSIEGPEKHGAQWRVMHLPATAKGT